MGGEGKVDGGNALHGHTVGNGVCQRIGPHSTGTCTGAVNSHDGRILAIDAATWVQLDCTTLGRMQTKQDLHCVAIGIGP